MSVLPPLMWVDEGDLLFMPYFISPHCRLIITYPIAKKE
jgi:hypothetical protein